MATTRWAILGTGEVAGKFALGLRQTKGAELSVVASRTAARAEAFARELGGRASTYSDAIGSADVDVVYIATPPSLHREQALACIAAGKPVLVEKPFAVTEAEAREVVDAARRAGLFCMEAMWTRFMPALAVAKAAVAAGAIGAPRGLSASFAVAQTVDPATSHFAPDLGGGALRHRGVYPISLALHLLGPAEVAGAWRLMGATGVDEDVSAVLDHSGGASSRIYASLRTSAENQLTVYGEGGRLRLLGPLYRPYGVEITKVSPRGRASSSHWGLVSRIKEGALAQHGRRWAGPLLSLAARRKRTVKDAPYAGNGYGHEAAAVMQCLQDGRLEHPLMTLDDTLAVARIVDRISAFPTTPTSASGGRS